MKLYCIVIICLISVKNVCFSQKNSLNVEILGNTGYGSIGYERHIYTTGKLHFHLETGLGSYQFRDFNQRFNPDFTLPVLGKAYYQLHLKHHIFLATGMIWNSFIDANDRWMAERMHRVHWINNAGYSYHIHSSFQVQAYYVALVRFNLEHWIGIKLRYIW